MNKTELATYVADLRERYFNEKHTWDGGTQLIENTHLKGMERAIELLDNDEPEEYPRDMSTDSELYLNNAAAQLEQAERGAGALPASDAVAARIQISKSWLMLAELATVHEQTEAALGANRTAEVDRRTVRWSCVNGHWVEPQWTNCSVCGSGA